MRVRITEYLDIDLAAEEWRCNRCNAAMGDARESYKKGCLIHDRDPREVHFPIGPSKEFNFSFDPKWMRIVEFYCPGCGTMVENEYLPPGHPLTWDIQLDIDKLKERHGVTTKPPKRRPKPITAAKPRSNAAAKPIAAKPRSATPKKPPRRTTAAKRARRR